MNKEHLEVAQLTLNSIIGIQDTIIDILKKLNKFEKQLTSLKMHKTSNKMCNGNELVDATIVRSINKEGEKNG